MNTSKKPPLRQELDYWTRRLDLEGLRVVHRHRGAANDPHRFTLLGNQGSALCPDCGRACDTVRRTQEIARVVDLPLGYTAVELTIRVSWYFCEQCRASFTPPTPGYTPGAPATERF